jgi:GntR family transcriptional regulator, rspAB operon transcriptional repressor
VLDTTNINGKAYDFIKRSIVRLKYPPGYRINIKELQKELGVSQTPIKDALFRLAGEGMIQISSRRGTYVKEITEKDISEIAEARIVIETGAIELLAKKISDEQLEEIESLYNKIDSSPLAFDYYIFMERDYNFHRGIISVTENTRLLDMYDRLNTHMQIVRFRFAKHRSRPLPWTSQDHLDILNALKERNAEKAKASIRKHCLKARDTLLAESNSNAEARQEQ